MDEKSLKEKLSQALTGSIGEAFTTLFSLNLAESEAADFQKANDIICSIGIAGAVDGNVSIGLSKNHACYLVGKMIGTEIAEMNSDVVDGCSELANLIAGGLKNRIASKDFNFEISIPTVIYGQLLHISSTDEVTHIRKLFHCDQLNILANLDFKLHKEKQEHSLLKKMAAQGNAADRLSELLKNKTQ